MNKTRSFKTPIEANLFAIGRYKLDDEMASMMTDMTSQLLLFSAKIPTNVSGTSEFEIAQRFHDPFV